MRTRRTKRTIAELTHEFELRQLIWRLDRDLPIKVGNTWYGRTEIQARLLRVALQQTRWIPTPAERVDWPLAEALVQQAGSLQPRSKPMEYPWESGRYRNRDTNRDQHTRYLQLPGRAAAQAIQTGDLPAVLATVTSYASSSAPARHWTLPASIDSTTLITLGACSQTELEHRAVEQVVEDSRLVVLLRTHDGEASIAHLLLPDALECTVGIISGTALGLSVQFRPTSDVVVGLVGRDAIVRFPEPSYV